MKRIAAAVLAAVLALCFGSLTATAAVAGEQDKLPICHSGAGSHWSYIAPDDSGYNGHQNHDNDIYGLSEAECLAKNPPPKVEGWYTWLVPNVVNTPPEDAGDVGWPQSYVGPGKDYTPPCGVWYQVDKYKATQAEIDAVLDGNQLDYGEDFDIVKDWFFVYGGDCQDPADATASVSISTGTCTEAGSAQVSGLLHAALDGTLDVSVGTHTATFIADDGHTFENGETTIQVEYTVPGKNTEACPTNVTCETIADGGTATNLDANGWFPSDTRSKGHADYVEGGLHIYTDPYEAGDSPDQRKLQWQKNVADFPLSQIGQFAADYDATSGAAPGVKAIVQWAPGLTSSAIWEEVYDANPGGQDLWIPESSNAGITAPDNGGGFGSTRHGTVNEWLTVYPDAIVTDIQFGVGSGVDADGVLHSIQIGCAEYGFDYQDIPVEVDWQIAPIPPQCGVNGALPSLLGGEHYSLAFDREFDGPGSYTITATAHSGYVISGQVSLVIEVLGALLYQDENSEGRCYIEPKEDDVKVESGEPKCGESEYPTTTTTIHYTVDPLTGEYIAGEPIVVEGVGNVDPQDVKSCDNLAFTGAVPFPLAATGIALLVLGLFGAFGTAIWRRVNN